MSRPVVISEEVYLEDANFEVTITGPFGRVYSALAVTPEDAYAAFWQLRRDVGTQGKKIARITNVVTNEVVYYATVN